MYEAIQRIDLEIPEGVTEIKPFAYKNGRDLRSVKIPASVEKIGEYAFYGCEYILDFSVSPDNPRFSSDDSGALFNKDKTVLLRASPCWDEQYDIPEGVTHIAPGAVANCCAEKITIPSTVVEIGDFAFEDCRWLREITIPERVTKIGKRVFKGCVALEEIFVKEQNPCYSSGGGGELYDKAVSTLLCVPGGMEKLLPIPHTVTRTGKYAFADSASLNHIFVFPEQEALLRKATEGCNPMPTIDVLDLADILGE